MRDWRIGSEMELFTETNLTSTVSHTEILQDRLTSNGYIINIKLTFSRKGDILYKNRHFAIKIDIWTCTGLGTEIISVLKMPFPHMLS